MILVTAAEMQKMDRLTIESHGTPGLELMESAGKGAARVLQDQFADRLKAGVGIICGKGNNGGDGFVIARYLADQRIRVTVYLLAKTSAVKGDAAANLKRLAPLNIPVIEIPDQDAFSKNTPRLGQHGLLVVLFQVGIELGRDGDGAAQPALFDGTGRDHLQIRRHHPQRRVHLRDSPRQIHGQVANGAR